MKAFSIRRRLVALLLGSLVAVWAAMLATGYVELREEVGEQADARMEQSARTLLLLDLKRLHALVGLDDGHEDGHESEHRLEHNDNHAEYVDFQVWGSDGALLLHAPGAPEARYDPEIGHGWVSVGDREWRTFALRDPKRGYQVRVFETARTRSHLVNKLAFRMAQMLLLALPVLALLVWLSIRRGLAPLTTVSHAIGSRSAQNLEPLNLASVPDEVQPLVDALNKLLERLSESIDRERSFTADAAHELRTPLAAIKVQAEVALAAEDEEQRRHAIQQVIAGVQRTTYLAQQLLLLARLDHVDAEQLQLVDLGHLAAGSAARFANAAEDKGIELEVDAQEACHMRSDPFALSILLDNLLDNAIKYGSDGGRAVVKVWKEHGQIMLRVQDDGPGVPADERSRLTDRFFRVTGTGVAGSGLGLSIVERIAKRYRGEVRIGEGMDGKGLGVTVSFPV
ncbi:MAG TPA: ATP-binding protein [Noviherbaspirillum sp.]|uniref:ATP-binding protein n=1 Tax=Noviherbaspirillum sp. TaxID=1926288 RepID=UPI002B4759C9|nr:ATP-binding protein [Noviherbaspirillum sp.]HJV87597.1 ATP-binding protein [Noviherbaspirillum sp.]